MNGIDGFELSTKMDDYGDLTAFFRSLKTLPAQYGLENITAALKLIGNPQHDFPTLHVAGTNGKGSTAAMLESIFRCNGYQTGLYTSPHLIQQRERIQVDRQLIPETALLEHSRYLLQALKDSGTSFSSWPSFFEWMTIVAFLHFKASGVDLAIIEAGMGGEKDATNLIHPVLSIVTSIGMDHEAFLGNSIRDIASHKAGIFKAGSRALVGPLPDEAMEIMQERVDQIGIRLHRLCEKGPNDCSQDDRETLPESNLHGDFQRVNAGLAFEASKMLTDRFPLLDEMTSLKALKCVKWPGRWESILINEGNNEIILDSSHNPEAIEALAQLVEQRITEADPPPVWVIGSTKKSACDALFRICSRRFARVYWISFSHPRSLPWEQVCNDCPTLLISNLQSIRSVADLFDHQTCRIVLEPQQKVIVTGSIYLTGEVSDRLKSKTPLNEMDLQD